MKSRPGRSLDWSEEKRRKAHQIFHENKDTKTRAEIAALIGVSIQHFYKMRKFQWWLELEEQLEHKS